MLNVFFLNISKKYIYHCFRVVFCFLFLFLLQFLLLLINQTTASAKGFFLLLIVVFPYKLYIFVQSVKQSDHKRSIKIEISKCKLTFTEKAMSVKKTRSDFFRLYSQKAFPTFGLGLLINSRLQFAEKENDVIFSVKIVVLPLALAGTRQLQPPSLL